MSIALAFVICLLLTPAIRKMAGGFTSPIKDELQDTQADKAGTCALGSLALMASFALASFLSGDRMSLYALASTAPFFLVGLADDVMKIRRRNADGFTSLTKLLLQLACAAFMAYLVKDLAFAEADGLIYYPAAILLAAASVNAVNITDGLDGLATKSIMPAIVLAAVALQPLRTANLIILATLSAWLIYNSRKASIFMGDGGSHMLGAFLAFDALAGGQVIGIILASIMVYLDLASSFVQIVAIRGFGRKVFLIAPFHHDLEKRGVGEEKIADLFLSLSILGSLLSALLIFKVA